MVTKNYKLVGFPVVIESVYNYVHKQCADYEYDGSTEGAVILKSTAEDIEKEKQRKKTNDIIEQGAVADMTDEKLESLIIYRKFCDIISERGCLLIHGCAVSVYNKAYIFTADNGVGKSTHAKLWLSHFGGRAEIINGNNPIIRLHDSRAYVYGTPWCGREGLNINKCISLNGICLLRRDKTNHIEEITVSEGYNEILQQCYRPSDPNCMSNTLNTLGRIIKNVKLYSLGCNMEPSAAIVAYEGMKNVVI